jgi:hypothetical protein
MPWRTTRPCWLASPACSMVICIVLNLAGSAADHMCTVASLLANVPAVMSSGCPGRLPGPAYQLREERRKIRCDRSSGSAPARF